MFRPYEKIKLIKDIHHFGTVIKSSKEFTVKLLDSDELVATDGQGISFTLRFKNIDYYSGYFELVQT